ncbi:hypothetical protein [Gallibacterium anatis]|uniref:Uncharacterized protein n=3 Tax=Gallibacterium anatis TaxID=750 RepID=U1I3I8_9PAST|nr:hypothetical protein [Gallibacterium anatis]ERF77880.1 hypothetical protein N561_09125 [Gallibacterium anatis 12656/12]KGQ47066.1 hypothetical protein JL04_11610 [Gallibacterium anatis]KGQ61801.1 hypothetical protein IO48_06640 [Gallibacterium anatis 4895]HJF73553.1 hypothetical protein [Gallibacterium anatis]
MSWKTIKQSSRVVIMVLLSCIGLTLLSAGLMHFFPNNEIKIFIQEYRITLFGWRIVLYAGVFYVLYKIGQKNTHWAAESKRLTKKMAFFVVFAEIINAMNTWEATNA